MSEMRQQIPGLTPFNVITTFAGCGGSSLGYKLAGGRVLVASEWDKNAAAVYRLNHSGTDLIEGDITSLTVDALLARAGLRPGELDIFDGSPPCQGFSTAGKRQFSDDRNQLFREYVRLLRGLKPKVFVMENVSGMVKGSMKLIFAEILQELKASGYRVSARLLNAKYFGVPQSRERMIFIGVRDDLGIEPSHPLPTSAPLTVRWAWTHPTDIRYQQGDTLKGPAALIAPHVAAGTNNGGGRVSKWVRGTTSGFGLSRLSWNKPSCTVPKLSLLSSSPLVHPEYNCRITIDQAKRLASFPDDFQLIGTFNEQWARIGNSVPPNFMKAIATHIRDNILARIQESRAA
jgi:DNA (cytosine-5)-methyltransferase 1